ncbi:flagellar biosynthesis protein FlhF [Salinimonas chungwhensis]|uniref:flagellar biosynthesis protein FlhF n=1 Tax=Salinimonas chungwhensis TaxID=265425 RepID=UPI000376F01C|nr:flagellar biosynthesis protein FlhF [Salinimonas chungwhensis]
MKIRRFFGKDMREAMNAVKAELGGEAVIMSNRKVADGIELVAAYDKEPEVNLSGNRTRTAEKQPAAAKGRSVPSLSEIIGDEGPDSLRALLEKQVGQAQRQAPAHPVSEAVNKHSAAASDQTLSSRTVPQRTAAENTAPRGQHINFFEDDGDLDLDGPQQHNDAPTQFTGQTADQTSSSQSDLDAIKEELASLRNVLQFQVAGLMSDKQQRQGPTQSYLTQCLEGMGLSFSLAEQLVSYTPKEYNEREAWVYLLNLLANRLHVSGNDILQQTGAVALVGPTGTGKTTTVAKLAARYAQKYGADEVAMITIDTYRIAAYEQLATYGKIIGCTVRKAQSSEELAELLFQLRHKRMVLIDTAGFSQRDSRLIKQLSKFEGGQMQPVKKYLVAQANTQYPALQRIVNAFDAVKLDGCIFTKLDECYSLGEVLSVAIEHALPVSYVTDGQQVPEDIKVADAKSLVSAAAKLYKKYGLNHTNGNHLGNSAQAV